MLFFNYYKYYYNLDLYIDSSSKTLTKSYLKPFSYLTEVR